MLHRTGPARRRSRRCAAPTPRYICKQLLELTDSEGAGRDRRPPVLQAVLDPRSIVVVAWIVLALLHRVIDRFVGSLSGQNQPTRRHQAHAAPHADRRPDAARQRARHRHRVDPGRRPRADPRPRAPLHRRLHGVEHRHHHDPRRARHQPRAADRRRRHRRHRARLRRPEPREGLPRRDLHHRGGPVRRRRHHRRRRAERHAGERHGRVGVAALHEAAVGERHGVARAQRHRAAGRAT